MTDSAIAIMNRRRAAVADVVAQAKLLEQHGVTRDTLEGIKTALTSLAALSDLFPAAHFPIPEGKPAALYRLSEDRDRRFALYASAGLPGNPQPPHNHTTWATIAGVFGDEHNVLYDRVDDRSVAGAGELRQTGELTIRRGNACALMPDDFHTIEVMGGPALHLHLYGMSLENLPHRICFAGSAGGSYRPYAATPVIFAPRLSSTEVKALLRSGDELALIDVREEGVFSKSHLLFATPLPLSRLELGLAALVPRRSTPIVLIDDDDGLADRAAALMMRLGYRNLAVLAGGNPAWKKAGYELFSGVHVPSKAFGEFIEHKAGTPSLSAQELKAKIDAGEKLVILDSRPMDEYRVMSIPGGIDCPGAELVRSVHDAAPSADTLVVVNCAGRTRSIIGAQSLINAGVPHKVIALRNGTMGWHLAGLTLEHNAERRAPTPSATGLAKARAAAELVGKRAGVRAIDRATCERLAAESDQRSFYLLDVRSPEEYASGHLRSSRSAPGGQLVQATDAYVGTRNARLVLVDDDGVRATMTASWLHQLGWDEVYVLVNGLVGAALERGAERREVLNVEDVEPQAIDPTELKAALERGGALVLDFANSLQYRDGHIAGAWFAIRARLAATLRSLPKHEMVVATSPDGELARFAAMDLQELSGTPVRALAGGTTAWRAAGLPLVQGTEHLANPAEDVWYRPYDRHGPNEAAMKEYLTWEIDLVHQIERDGDARFRVLD
jgi:rhodanese-related sulfurtransferase/predicted metal-dependent enzyme (double-stranded beta helix superfamily)